MGHRREWLSGWWCALPKASNQTHFLRWTCTALNTSSRFSTTKSPSWMQWSPRCGGCELGCSAADVSMEARQPSTSVLAPAARSPSQPGGTCASASTAPTCCTPLPLSGPEFGTASGTSGDFRPSELFDWLPFVPPPPVAWLSLKQKRVIDAPKKNFKRSGSLPSGGVRDLPPPCVSRSEAQFQAPGCSGDCLQSL